MGKTVCAFILAALLFLLSGCTTTSDLDKELGSLSKAIQDDLDNDVRTVKGWIGIAEEPVQRIQQTNPTPPAKSQQANATPQNDYSVSGRILATAFESRDTKECNKISESYNRNWCIYYIAIAEKDPELCRKIEPKTWYLQDCIKNVAIRLNDLELCKELPTLEQKECVKKINLKLGNVDYCNSLEPNYSIDYCYREFAVMRQDPEICTKLFNDTETGKTCMLSVLSNSAFDKIKPKEFELSVCDYFTNQSQKDMCIYYVAHSKQNQSICELIGNQNSIYTAYTTVACKKSISAITQTIDQCIEERALPTARASSNYCLHNHANNPKDEQTCIKIREIEPSLASICYTNLASLTGNLKFCSNVQRNMLYSCYSSAIANNVHNMMQNDPLAGE